MLDTWVTFSIWYGKLELGVELTQSFVEIDCARSWLFVRNLGLFGLCSSWGCHLFQHLRHFFFQVLILSLKLLNLRVFLPFYWSTHSLIRFAISHSRLCLELHLFNLLLSLIERNFKLRILYLESIRNLSLPQVQTYLLLQLLYHFILALNRLLKILIDGLGSGELFIDAQRVISQCFQLILLLTIGNF